MRRDAIVEIGESTKETIVQAQVGWYFRSTPSVPSLTKIKAQGGEEL
jgi:hypothetical protein